MYLGEQKKFMDPDWTEIGPLVGSRFIDIVCLYRDVNGDVRQQEISHWVETEEELPFTDSNLEVEVGLVKAARPNGKKRGKSDILYVCNGSLQARDINTCGFPIYRQNHGTVTLRDNASIHSVRKLDMIVVSASATHEPGYAELLKSAVRALRN